MHPWELRGGRTNREWKPVGRMPVLYGEIPAKKIMDEITTLKENKTIFS